MRRIIRAVVAIGALFSAVLCSSVGFCGWKEEVEAADMRADYATSLRIVEPLAVQGDAAAQASLGVRYLHGWGVTQDYGKAISWFRRAAEQGNSEAYSWLGVIYQRGEGVPKDIVEAAKWNLKAADAGSSFAQMAIAIMYFTGQGVPRNYVEAYKWMQLAVEGEKDEKNRKLFESHRDTLIKRQMTIEQISQAEFLVQEWKVKHK